MVAVTVTSTGSTLNVGPPKPLFDVAEVPSYDVTPDGQRLLMLRPDYSQSPRQLVLVHQWTSEMRR
jgi:hypothetical protein